MTNPAQHDTHICPLPQYGLLSIASADNLKFLQGQFTCDLREVTAEQWRYGALCTNKGRMVSNFVLAEAAKNHHLLRLQRSTLTAVQETLKKFAPFYKGTLHDATLDYQLIGINGPDSASRVKALFGQLPAGNGHVVCNDTGLLLQLSESRFECWLRAALPAPQTNSAATHWDLLNIRAGLGEVCGTTIEEWTPHMLNLQLTGAVNFKKGCYTGQEIVARTEYRGHQKRAMYRISGEGAVPSPAEKILDGTQEAGEIVMSAPTGTGWEALAVLGDGHLEKPLTCGNRSIAVLTLPYPIKKSA